MINNIYISIKPETIMEHEELMKINEEYRFAYVNFIAIAKKFYEIYRKPNKEK